MKIQSFALVLLLSAPFVLAKVHRPARVTASSELAITPAQRTADGKTRVNRHAYWCTERQAKPPHTLTFHYDKPVKINRVMIYQVDFSINHQLDHYILEALSKGEWTQLAEFRADIREFLKLQETLTPDDPRYYSLSKPNSTINTFDFPDIAIEQLRLTVFDHAARVVEMQAIYLTEAEKNPVVSFEAPADSTVKAYSLAKERNASSDGFHLLGPESFKDHSNIAFADRLTPGPGRAAFAASQQERVLSIPLAAGRYQLLALSGDDLFPGPGCTLKFAGKRLRISQTGPGDFAWDTALFSVATDRLEITLEGPWLLNTLLIAPLSQRQEFDQAVNRLMLEGTAESKAKKYVYLEQETHLQPPKPSQEDIRFGHIPYVPSIQQRIYRQTTPTAAQQQATLRLDAARGTSRAGSLAIYALEELEQVQLTLKGELPGELQILHVRQHPQKVGGKGSRPQWAVVPELLEPRQFSDVRQGESLQFYILAEIPASAKAGLYRATLSLSAAGKAVRNLPLEVEVYPFALSEAFAHSCFGMYYGSRASRLFDLPEPLLRATLRDMRKHNMSTIVLEDSRKQPMNEDYLRQVNTILDAEGFPAHPMPYSCGASISAERAAELSAIVKRNQWRELLFYPVDEPFGGGEERLNRAIKIYNELKAAPGVRTYSTVTQNDINAIGHGLDVRCYTVNHNNFQPDRILAECAALPEKEFWWYSNGTREYPDVVRFKAGPFHYRCAARGQFYWAYLNPRGDIYNDFDEGSSDHVAVFIQDGQIVPTLQWESIREGIDDYRYLHQLQALCQKHAADQPEASKAGLQLLAEIHGKLPNDLGDYQKRFGRVLDIHEKSWWEPEEFDLQRRRIAEAIMRFK